MCFSDNSKKVRLFFSFSFVCFFFFFIIHFIMLLVLKNMIVIYNSYDNIIPILLGWVDNTIVGAVEISL